MWNGDYNFFDYKYNIVGYEGQDYLAPIQYIMSAIAIAIIVVLLIIFRNADKNKSKKFLFWFGIFMTCLYIGKTTWESFYDIARDGEFNLGILPFDTCSLFMPALIIAGCSKKDSKLETFAATFLSTIGFAGGVANVIFLRGLKYYPMFAFGGLYSFFWHIAMIFVALFIPCSKFHKFKFIDILNSMVVLLVSSLYVVPYNYLTNSDFMQLNGAGGVPLIENLADSLIKANLRPLATLLMLVAYLAVSALMVSIYICVGRLIELLSKKKPEKQLA